MMPRWQPTFPGNAITWPKTRVLAVSKAGLGWAGSGLGQSTLFLPNLQNKPRTLVLGSLGRERPLKQWAICPSLCAPG